MNVYHENQVPWPANKPETKTRKSGPFTTNMSDACKRIEKEVAAFTRAGKNWRTKEVWIFADADLGVKNRFLSNSKGLRDPKVSVRFDLDGAEYNIAADAYFEPWQNLVGIAKYIESIRAQERNGIFTAQEMMASFAALPAPQKLKPWFQVMRLGEGASLEAIEAAYRFLAKQHHPDVPTGSTEAFQELQAAYESAKAARQ